RTCQEIPDAVCQENPTCVCCCRGVYLLLPWTFIAHSPGSPIMDETTAERLILKHVWKLTCGRVRNLRAKGSAACIFVEGCAATPAVKETAVLAANEAAHVMAEIVNGQPTCIAINFIVDGSKPPSRPIRLVSDIMSDAIFSPN